MEENILRTNEVSATETNLNSLFFEILQGCRDDLNEADKNVLNISLNLENSDRGVETYGPIYNESLKIKGDARDRQIKFLAIFKDRVTKKEQFEVVSKKNETEWAHLPDTSKMNEWLKEQETEEEEEIKSTKPKRGRKPKIKDFIEVKNLDDDNDLQDDFEIDNEDD